MTSIFLYFSINCCNERRWLLESIHVLFVKGYTIKRYWLIDVFFRCTCWQIFQWRQCRVMSFVFFHTTLCWYMCLANSHCHVFSVDCTLSLHVHLTLVWWARTLHSTQMPFLLLTRWRSDRTVSNFIWFGFYVWLALISVFFFHFLSGCERPRGTLLEVLLLASLLDGSFSRDVATFSTA